MAIINTYTDDTVAEDGDKFLIVNSDGSTKLMSLATLRAEILGDGDVTAAKIGATAITLDVKNVTSNQSGITTETDVTGLSSTVTFPAGGRKVEVHTYLHCFSSVAGDAFTVSLYRDGTVVQTFEDRFQAASQQTAVYALWHGTETSGSHTYKVTLRRASGTGSLSTFQSATRPAQLVIKAA